MKKLFTLIKKLLNLCSSHMTFKTYRPSVEIMEVQVTLGIRSRNFSLRLQVKKDEGGFQINIVVKKE